MSIELPRKTSGVAGLVIAGLLIGCGSPSANPTGAAPGATSGTATPAPVPTSGGGNAGSGSTVLVTLVGGPDAGSYQGGADPLCTNGLIGPDGWGVQYSIADAPADSLSSVQVIASAEGRADDEDAMFSGVAFKLTVTIGDLATGRSYDVTVASADADFETSGQGSASVEDRGATAVIHATGTTADGVEIDATINCPNVTRVGG